MEANGKQIHEKKKRDFALEKKGKWSIKRQRQGEADNPGPSNFDSDSEGETMPALIQEEESEPEEYRADRTDDEESDDDEGRFFRREARDIAKAGTHAAKKNSVQEVKQGVPAIEVVDHHEEGPEYQPRQDTTSNANYTPGSKRGRRSQSRATQQLKVISNNCATMAPKKSRNRRLAG